MFFVPQKTLQTLVGAKWQRATLAIKSFYLVVNTTELSNECHTLRSDSVELLDQPSSDIVFHSNFLHKTSKSFLLTNLNEHMLLLLYTAKLVGLHRYAKIIQVVLLLTEIFY